MRSVRAEAQGGVPERANRKGMVSDIAPYGKTSSKISGPRTIRPV